jgi:hypothetical protein
MKQCRRPILLVFAMLAAAGCGSAAVAPTPAPDPTSQVAPIESSGPIRITFVTANVLPGGVVTGCGSLVEGCTGRLRLTLRLEPPADGPVLYARIYLHATNLVACLWGESAPFTVRAGSAQTIDISIDRADRCGTPATIATMAAVVEGPIQVASRQTWSLHYVFAP